jgi:hypothetical protein
MLPTRWRSSAGNPTSGATIYGSVTFSMARYGPLLVPRKERILGSPRFLEHCRPSPGNPPRPRATALTKAFPVVALSAGVSPSRFRELGGDVQVLDSAFLIVTRLFRCVLFGSRSPSPCSDLLPTAASLRASLIKPFFRDARNPHGAPTDSASARAFLSGSPMLSYWCEVAELDLHCVIVRARTLMAGCDAGRRGCAGSDDVH